MASTIGGWQTRTLPVRTSTKRTRWLGLRERCPPSCQEETSWLRVWHPHTRSQPPSLLANLPQAFSVVALVVPSLSLPNLVRFLRPVTLFRSRLRDGSN